MDRSLSVEVWYNTCHWTFFPPLYKNKKIWIVIFTDNYDFFSVWLFSYFSSSATTRGKIRALSFCFSFCVNNCKSMYLNGMSVKSYYYDSSRIFPLLSKDKTISILSKSWSWNLNCNKTMYHLICMIYYIFLCFLAVITYCIKALSRNSFEYPR